MLTPSCSHLYARSTHKHTHTYLQCKFKSELRVCFRSSAVNLIKHEEKLISLEPTDINPINCVVKLKMSMWLGMSMCASLQMRAACYASLRLV